LIRENQEVESMPKLTANLADAGAGTCDYCDVENPAHIRFVEPFDQYAPRLCFRHGVQLLKSDDPIDKKRARRVLIAK
jgi:hypothetical protein